ncbi:MAG: NAD(+) kinase [Gammaproteobacteria bacterium]|nr:NAD(+) kinase [Gammaproteobacteria bacterium]MXY57568.1 NAD(+) kinase [Gammaproteobacteria bacterium]MYF30233.1 NAD(+) kinase [Gammaproteobacteria bacterium]MYK44767.1 NAD(+) kinase [Gammaproteobacteria bacterium]
MTDFRRVAIVGRTGSSHVVESLNIVVSALNTAGVELVYEERTAAMLSRSDGVPREAVGCGVDLVVVVGGDGSILGVARDVAHAGVPVLGVNRGGLGFLADIAPDQISEKVAQVMAGAYRVEERFLLEASVRRLPHAGRAVVEGDAVEVGVALNDVVVHAGSMSRMMDFQLFIDDEFIYEQRSDGLIISTPTGSTAYALSAGGPILHPRLDAVEIVPMFPHTLTSRPLVVNGDSTISVRIGDAAATPKVSCDSQVDFALGPTDEVRIVKHRSPLRLAFPIGHSFYESCRSKLDWATRLGGRR